MAIERSILHSEEFLTLNWQVFSQRMRLSQLRWRDVLWGLAIFVVGGMSMGLISSLFLTLIQRGWMPLPSHLRAIADPQGTFTPEMLAKSQEYGSLSSRS